LVPSVTDSWPYLLASLDPYLKLIHNSAVPGNTTAQMVDRFSRDVLRYRPDLLFVMGGTNDVGARWPAAATVANLRAIVRAAKSRGIEVVLMTMPPNNGCTKSQLAAMRRANAGLKAMAGQEGIRVIDVYTALANAAGRLPNSLVARDRLHLSLVGERAIAQLVYRTMYPAGPELD
jgi:lysophospholipase L1-like esterase